MEKIVSVHLYPTHVMVYRRDSSGTTHGHERRACTRATLERWCQMARIYGKSVWPFADGGWVATF